MAFVRALAFKGGLVFRGRGDAFQPGQRLDEGVLLFFGRYGKIAQLAGIGSGSVEGDHAAGFLLDGLTSGALTGDAGKSKQSGQLSHFAERPQ